MQMAKFSRITMEVNGTKFQREVEARKLLVDFLREDLDLLGTHVGCEHGVCGSCTILFNGRTVRSCLIFAIQADGAEIMTVEGLAENGKLHSIQEAFRDYHGLQCGFCTPGMLMTAYEFLHENPDPTKEEARKAVSGVLCRCTGYKQVVDSVMAAAAVMNSK
ncbi:MAG: 2Fe-2S iron-sulfur cluster binding domain-containing protein [Anaerolineales bacterium]|nr:2Fe-2S iron-sulfur cluster binding domain-containing protein [Anaerolineales bacterium]